MECNYRVTILKRQQRNNINYFVHNFNNLEIMDLQKSYVLPHMWTLDQGQTQQGDWNLITREKREHTREI
jgi:hypothetical protein